MSLQIRKGHDGKKYYRTNTVPSKFPIGQNAEFYIYSLPSWSFRGRAATNYYFTNIFISLISFRHINLIARFNDNA